MDPLPPTANPERGLTLLEVMVVLGLAVVVTLGLIGFYLNSQATWLDASQQALAQRDATLILESVTAMANGAASYVVLESPSSPDNSEVIFYSGPNGSGTEIGRFRWEAADSTVHRGTDSGNLAPMVPSLVERFVLTSDPSGRLLHVSQLQVRATTGQRIQMESTMALFNAP